jgi:hypothetical protein
VTLGAGRLLSLPVDGKMTRIIAHLLLSLPFDIGTRWANQIDAIIRLAAVQSLGIDIARIHDMLIRHEIFLFEPFMNDGRPRVV